MWRRKSELLADSAFIFLESADESIGAKEARRGLKGLRSPPCTDLPECIHEPGHLKADAQLCTERSHRLADSEANEGRTNGGDRGKRDAEKDWKKWLLQGERSRELDGISSWLVIASQARVQDSISRIKYNHKPAKRQFALQSSGSWARFNQDSGELIHRRPADFRYF